MKNETELAQRRIGNLEVCLLWNRMEDSVCVTVVDDESGETLRLPVSRERALDAFYHPYAYADAA